MHFQIYLYYTLLENMYKCFKCNKEFNYESDFIRHKNRKTDCNKNNSYDCNICNKNFKYESKLHEHEKTKKHKSNINKDKLVGEINNNVELEEIANLKIKN